MTEKLNPKDVRACFACRHFNKHEFPSPYVGVCLHPRNLTISRVTGRPQPKLDVNYMRMSKGDQSSCNFEGDWFEPISRPDPSTPEATAIRRLIKWILRRA